MNEKPKPQSFSWPFWLVLTVIIFLLAGLTCPITVRSKKKPKQTEAISNLRQIGLALYEFESEYGDYPNKETAAAVTANHSTRGLDFSGDSSNALFRQLIAAGITQSEQMFYAKVTGANKPDGDTSPGNALERGEVGFGYVSGMSTTGNPARIIAFAPIIPGTTKFDPKPFEGKAVAVRIDNSVGSYNIREDGSIGNEYGDLLSPTNPIWGGTSFKIHYPDLDTTPGPGFFKRIFSYQ